MYWRLLSENQTLFEKVWQEEFWQSQNQLAKISVDVHTIGNVPEMNGVNRGEDKATIETNENFLGLPLPQGSYECSPAQNHRLKTLLSFL